MKTLRVLFLFVAIYVLCWGLWNCFETWWGLPTVLSSGLYIGIGIFLLHREGIF